MEQYGDRRVTGRWQPSGCPCPRCGKCGCGIERCVNRLAPNPLERICGCPWVPVVDMPKGRCFQVEAGYVAVAWHTRGPEVDVRRVIMMDDSTDSEYGSPTYLPPNELVKPMDYSVPVEEDFLAQDARDRLERSSV